MLYRKFNQETFDCWCSDGAVCTKEYLEQSESIGKVKSHIMEWINNVEEACLFVEDTLNNQIDTDEVGTEVDAEKEMNCVSS